MKEMEKNSSTSEKLILIVEDDMMLSAGLIRALQEEGRKIERCGNIRDARHLITQKQPDLMILDINLPDGSGYDFLTELRKEEFFPIILLTANDMETDIVTGLEAGADDYITKPFGSSELMARIRTALRHGAQMAGGMAAGHPYRSGGLTIDFDRRLVTVEEKPVHLTQVEFKIVSFLAVNSGRVMTYDAIISHVWGPYADDNNRILRVNMANIRRKLEKNPAEPHFILTEIGVGYRMAEDEGR